jgi:hypothetical protein
LKFKSIKSISEYAAKKHSPPLQCHSQRTFSGATEVPPLAPHQSWELAGGRRGGLSFEMLIFSRFCCGKWRGLRVVEWGQNNKKLWQERKSPRQIRNFSRRDCRIGMQRSKSICPSKRPKSLGNIFSCTFSVSVIHILNGFDKFAAPCPSFILKLEILVT